MLTYYKSYFILFCKELFMWCCEIMRYDRRSKNNLTTVRHFFYKTSLAARRCQKNALLSNNTVYAVVHSGVEKSDLKDSKFLSNDSISYVDLIRSEFNA